jgi:hypothetical protein
MNVQFGSRLLSCALLSFAVLSIGDIFHGYRKQALDQKPEALKWTARAITAVGLILLVRWDWPSSPSFAGLFAGALCAIPAKSLLSWCGGRPAAL